MGPRQEPVTGNENSTGTPELVVLGSANQSNRDVTGWRNRAAEPLSGYMNYAGRAVMLLGALAIAYIWLTSTVDARGEKRYEQYVRQVKDRHSNGN